MTWKDLLFASVLTLTSTALAAENRPAATSAPATAHARRAAATATPTKLLTAHANRVDGAAASVTTEGRKIAFVAQAKKGKSLSKAGHGGTADSAAASANGRGNRIDGSVASATTEGRKIAFVAQAKKGKSLSKAGHGGGDKDSASAPATGHHAAAVEQIGSNNREAQVVAQAAKAKAEHNANGRPSNEDVNTHGSFRSGLSGAMHLSQGSRSFGGMLQRLSPRERATHCTHGGGCM